MEFEDSRDAEDAMRALNGRRFEGSILDIQVCCFLFSSGPNLVEVLLNLMKEMEEGALIEGKKVGEIWTGVLLLEATVDIRQGAMMIAIALTLEIDLKEEMKEEMIGILMIEENEAEEDFVTGAIILLLSEAAKITKEIKAILKERNINLKLVRLPMSL